MGKFLYWITLPFTEEVKTGVFKTGNLETRPHCFIYKKGSLCAKAVAVQATAKSGFVYNKSAKLRNEI